MADVVIRPYRGTDEPALLDLWRAALPADPIDRATFRRKVLLDPNFDPAWLLLAEQSKRLVGFCLALVRRVPLEKVGLQPETAWISAMGVHPSIRRRGIGGALLEHAIDLCRQANRQFLTVAAYIPNYFVPGIDVVRYADGVEFLARRGFEELDRPIAMDAALVGRDLSPFTGRAASLAGERGVQVRYLQSDDLPALMGFLQEHMPGDWVRHARELLLDICRGNGDFDQFTVALREGAIVGYCQFDGEHFGPFGVRDGLQGQGIGTVLLATCLQAMQDRGLHTAFVLWTSDANADKVYSRFGFRESRRFSVRRRSL
jgi:GNAT superfamily N-acetyltransferase